jgi:uncharacterized membrane protein YkvA (DUF1232 family)
MAWFASLKQQAQALRQQSLTVYFAARDPRTPWAVRLLALLIAAYALSPIDLIPDFVPVLGYLDDLVLIPLGLALVIRLTPAPVIDAARARAQQAVQRPVSYAAAAAIVLAWLVVLGAIAWWLHGAWRD